MVDSRIARSRSRYLEGHLGPFPVRPMVLASWERSTGHHLRADRIEVPYLAGYEPDTPLGRAAVPVLDALHDQLSNEPVSTMLTDKNGVILARRVSHDALSSRLEIADLTPGHVFSEEFVGTNGIGTALASGAAVTIDGPEHFATDLGCFSCAAVPILHPTRRNIVGAFNLTTGVELGTGPMALALATSTARQIERELALIASHREYLLFERYLEACRAFRRTPVLAFNADVVMMNDRLRAAVTGADQTALLDHARDRTGGAGAVGAGRTLSLPSGLVVELRPATPGPPDHGQVLVVCPVGRGRRGVRTPPARHVPGLIGSDPVWLKAVADLDAAYSARSWICLLGEAGTGKAHLIGALHRSHGGGPSVVVEPSVDDCRQSEDDLVDALARNLPRRDALVLLRNTQWMSARLRMRVVDLLGELDPADTGRLVLTAQPSALSPEDELVALCRAHVELPPLRHRHADVLALARHFLRRYRPAGDVTFGPSGEHALQRFGWPTNVRQLEGVIRRISTRPSSGRVEAADLPPECRVATTLALTPLQEIERDAIVRGLVGHDLNVMRTARDLGISRATMYRRMRRYGIDPAAL